MKKTFILAITILSNVALAWGPTGHRAVAEIAQRHLRADVAKNLRDLLGGYSLAEVTNWADEIRNDSQYDAFKPLHYVHILPQFKSYSETTPADTGDVIVAIQTLMAYLKSNDTDKLKTVSALAGIDRPTAVKLLVHFVGDIHQPLHVLDANDKSGASIMGGNRLKVNWMNKWTSNLHSIWDDEMLDHERLSYSEMASFYDHATADEQKEWTSTPIPTWADEAVAFKAQVFAYPDKQTYGTNSEPGITDAINIGYGYLSVSRPIFRKRIEQGGIRLAFLLNSLY
jgi:hypothetical protein